MTDSNSRFTFKFYILTKAILLLAMTLFAAACSFPTKTAPIVFSNVRTILHEQEKFGEPFGIAARGNEIFFSDGETGKIWRVDEARNFTAVSDKFDTPSQIAFDKNGDLIVADAGTHTIKKLKIETGAIETIAGVENRKGFADGTATAALFNAPIGVAVAEEAIYVADTYNDKIRVVKNGAVSTVAGDVKGFADGSVAAAKFDTPCGLAIWKDKLLVADTGNRRLRIVEPYKTVWTFAGNGAEDERDDFPNDASFVEPTAVTVDRFGVIYVADGNSIRIIGRRFFPFVETLTATKRGFADGALRESKFNRPSGLAADENGNLFVADADNQTIRVLTGAENVGAEITKAAIEKMRGTPAEFRRRAAARWTYDPPQSKREIAGTLGEIRGERESFDSQIWFHNGLDIVGGYGETARFIRPEKVLQPIAVENFSTLRELIRMPTLGYIHIRLGRDKDDRVFGDPRFGFFYNAPGKIGGVRVPRGAKFQAGEAIGTLNPMNHVHLIAGRRGAEMNALDALELPGISDSIAPTIQQISLYNENWQRLGETENKPARIKLDGKTRIVARAHDRMDGNAERRRLGVFKIGYQILQADETPVSEMNWTISFDRLPEPEAARFVYAVGSKSGATGETIFDYIASNRVNGDEYREDFFDAGGLANGEYILRVAAADFFGNQTFKDVNFVR